MNSSINHKNKSSSGQNETEKQNYYHEKKYLSPMKNRNINKSDRNLTLDINRTQESLNKEILKNENQVSILPPISKYNNEFTSPIKKSENSAKESNVGDNLNFHSSNLTEPKSLKNNKDQIVIMNSSPDFINKIDLMRSHPFRHLIFSPYITIEMFNKYLTLTLKGLIYSSRHLKEPSLAFVESKQIKLPFNGNLFIIFI